MLPRDIKVPHKSTRRPDRYQSTIDLLRPGAHPYPPCKNIPGNSTQHSLIRSGPALRALRNQLLEVRSRNDLEPLDINAAENQQAREYEDDAQRLNASELDGNLANAGEVRLAAVERALQKLDEGSYGYSEASGEPIPIARLQASPEALFTLRGAEGRVPADSRLIAHAPARSAIVAAPVIGPWPCGCTSTAMSVASRGSCPKAVSKTALRPTQRPRGWTALTMLYSASVRPEFSPAPDRRHGAAPKGHQHHITDRRARRVTRR